MGFKSGFITIIGRPNVGKSTLMNRLLGQKIAIVSAKSQTTRNCIRGILTTDDYQMVFLDTPGIHKPQNKLGEYMMKAQRQAQEGCDAIVAMVTADERFGPTDTAMLDNLRGVSCPCYAIVNKMDAASPVHLEAVKQRLSEYEYLQQVFFISATSGEGTDALLQTLIDMLPEGPAFFPDDLVCDFPERFLAQEVVREKMLEVLMDEVPHGVGVDIVKMQERSGGKLYILADIFCERKSHKGIIIGKNGSMLKTIGTNARIELEELLEAPVFLELFVKVQQDWRNMDGNLRQLGYKEN